jgi:hypothetical protein
MAYFEVFEKYLKPKHTWKEPSKEHTNARNNQLNQPKWAFSTPSWEYGEVRRSMSREFCNLRLIWASLD